MKKSVNEYSQLDAGSAQYYYILRADRSDSADAINKLYRTICVAKKAEIAQDPSILTAMNKAKEVLLDEVCR